MYSIRRGMFAFAIHHHKSDTGNIKCAHAVLFVKYSRNLAALMAATGLPL
jgi:hypothetical protein